MATECAVEVTVGAIVPCCIPRDSSHSGSWMWRQRRNLRDLFHISRASSLVYDAQYDWEALKLGPQMGRCHCLDKPDHFLLFATVIIGTSPSILDPGTRDSPVVTGTARHGSSRIQGTSLVLVGRDRLFNPIT